MANINELINEIDEVMEDASSVPFSRKVSVDPEEISAILDEIRKAIPEEIKEAQWIHGEKDRIISEANSAAELRLEEVNNQIANLKEDARKQYQKMINEHEITNQARQEANRIISEANAEAQRLKQQSYEYINKLFTSSSENFSQLAQSLEKNRRRIIEEN